MSDANCFIILGDATGNVEPGTTVEVQLLERAWFEHRLAAGRVPGARGARASSTCRRSRRASTAACRSAAIWAFAWREVAKGRIVFTGRPGENVLNLIGTVHGGYAATILDTAPPCRFSPP